MADTFKDDSLNEETEDEFFGADGGDGDGGSDQGFSLDLTGDDLTDGSFKEIPVGTWMHVNIYEVQPETTQSGKNIGKPRYSITFCAEDDDTEWGEKRKLNEKFVSLYGKAFFKAYAIFKALGIAPTKDQLDIGAYFSDSYISEFPIEMQKYISEGGIFKPLKEIPNGSYIIPSPSKLLRRTFYAKVGSYSGNDSGFKEYRSEKAALDDQEFANTRAYPKFSDFKSEEAYAAMMEKQAEGLSAFKGEK